MTICQATLVTILVSLMALWGSLLYAARYLLQRNFLYNIPLLVSFAVVLVWIFVVLAGDFRAVRNEFDTSLFHAEAWLFTVMPMTCSALVTWCLCIELPDLEFPLCFSVVYAGYLAVLASPRKSHLSDQVVPSSANSWNFIISERNLITLYVLPCIISPILHIVVHRNVIMRLALRIQGFLLSVAVPSVLVLSIAEKQVNYWPLESQSNILRVLEMWKMGMLIVGAFSIKDHPFFDDLKVFSSYNMLPEGLLTPVLSVTLLLSFAALYQYQRVKSVSKVEDNIYGTASGPSSVLFNHPLLSVCVAISALGVGLMIGVTLAVLPMFVLGVLALTEYYLATSSGLMRGHELLGISLVAIGVFPIIMVCKSFTDVTLRFLMFQFSGAFGLSVDIGDFCTYCMLLTATAVVLPTLLADGGGSTARGFEQQLGFMPGRSHRETMSLFWSGAASVVFSVGSVLFTCFVCFLEIIVREHDWSSVSPSVEYIYPSWLFILTGAALVAATYHVYALGVVDITAVMCIVVIECCKFLHLGGISADEIFTTGALLLVLLFPFFAKISQMTEVNTADVGGVNGLYDIVQLVLYTILTLWPILWARESIIDTLLRKGLGHPPTELQLWCACVAIFTAFVTCGLLVFWKSAAFIRR